MDFSSFLLSFHSAFLWGGAGSQGHVFVLLFESYFIVPPDAIPKFLNCSYHARCSSCPQPLTFSAVLRWVQPLSLRCWHASKAKSGFCQRCHATETQASSIVLQRQRREVSLTRSHLTEAGFITMQNQPRVILAKTSQEDRIFPF